MSALLEGLERGLQTSKTQEAETHGNESKDCTANRNCCRGSPLRDSFCTFGTRNQRTNVA